jgi:hypothetical protein
VRPVKPRIRADRPELEHDAILGEVACSFDPAVMLRASVRHTAVDPVEVRRQDANRRHGRGEFIMSRRSFNPERPGAT